MFALAVLLCLSPQFPPPLESTDAQNPWPPSLTNGEFGTTIPPLGVHPSGRHRFRTVVAGVWNGALYGNDGWPNYQVYLPEVPCPAQLALRLADQDLFAGPVADYRQTLELATGELRTTFTTPGPAGPVHVAVRQFASRVRPELFATEVRVVAPAAATLTATATLDLANARGVRWVAVQQDEAAGTQVLRLRTLVPETADFDATDLEEAQALQFAGATASARQTEDRIQLVRQGEAAAGRETVVTLLTTLRSSRRAPLWPFFGLGPLRGAAAAGFTALADEHAAAWRSFWSTTRIEIAGDDELQQIADSGLYWLCSALRPGGDDSLGPMGLSKLDRNSYAGHVFWDAETWMFPPLLLLQPDLARSMLEYRFTRREGARLHGILRGVTSPGTPWHSRALDFPWESARSGEEATPRWFVPADEIHVNACIALAFWQFAQLHGDEPFVRERAAPVTSGIAWFYAARARKEDDGRWHLRGVTGADEWAERKDDSAYVNATASRALRIAAEFSDHPDPLWREVADGLVQPFDAALGVHPEHATYRGEGIKQADVVLLAHPWGLVDDPERIRADLEYYEPRTASEAPAMSHAIHTILHARLGETDRALAELDAAWRKNVHGPFRLWSETPGNGCVNFLTGVGGFLQALLHGFGGLRVESGGLSAAPSLPPKWRSFTVRGLCVGGSVVDLVVDHAGSRIVPRRGELPAARLRMR